MAGMKKLKIVAYKDQGFSSKTGKNFEVMVNPGNYDEKKRIEYDKDQALDGGNSPAYKKYKSEEMKVEFMLDTTGVLIDWKDPVALAQQKPLSAVVKELEDAVYTYVGDTHEPPYLGVEWGANSFQGRLKDLNVNYLLFTSDGEPLRAKVTLNLLKFIDNKTQALMKNKSSPDLSHLVTVKDGDTLPALCLRIYKSTAYCTEVARVNGLTGFRRLEPGLQLLFPPLG